jgi:glycine C-acetyltransferase
VVDDSHSTGVLGKTGRGTAEHFGMLGQIDIITSTLGKALGGAAGGFVAGSAALCDYLTQRGRPQLFSNALPTTVAGARWPRSGFSRPTRKRVTVPPGERRDTSGSA